MTRLAQDEYNGVRPTHPEGNVQECTGLSGENHWGDYHGEHDELRIGYLNIQTFPSDMTPHKMVVLYN